MTLKSPETYAQELNMVSAQDHLDLEEFAWLVELYKKRYGAVLNPELSEEEQWEGYNDCIKQYDNLSNN